MSTNKKTTGNGILEKEFRGDLGSMEMKIVKRPAINAPTSNDLATANMGLVSAEPSV